MSPRRLAAKTRIQRAGNGHSYYLDGEKVPGVTTIIGNGIPKPGLVGWSAGACADIVTNNLQVARNEKGDVRIVADDLVRELLEWNATRGSHAVKVPNATVLPRGAIGEILKNIRYRDLDEASGKGTTVHSIAQSLAAGEEVTSPEGLEGHVESYVRFLDEWDPTEALLERVVVSRRWGYMGKLDLLASFPGVWAEGTTFAGRDVSGEPVGRGLLDVKTSRSGIFAETALQLAGYGFAETMLDGVDADGTAIEIPLPPVDWFGAIHVRADGYDVFRMNVAEREHRIFLYAKQVGEWLDWKEGPASEAKSDSLRPPVRTDHEETRP